MDVKEIKGSLYLNLLNKILKNIDITDSNDTCTDFDKSINIIIRTIISQTDIGKKLIFIGNGGNTTICEHLTFDFINSAKIKAINFNNPALLTSIGNTQGSSKVFEGPMNIFAEQGDVVVAVSSTGKTENILNAVQEARNKSCFVITLTGFEDTNPLRSMGEYNIFVPSAEYGFVELSHQILLHMMLDMILLYKGLK